MMQVLPVILCGGSGSRLWPLSRAGFPKQFLALTGKESLFQLAALRLHALANNNIAIERSLIVTNEEHRFLAQEQLRELATLQASFLLEPAARNTAAALTLAALEALEGGADPILVASPADQNIGDEAAYAHSVRQAITLANAGGVVILGIPPDRPETGFGYIQFDKNIEKSGQAEGHRVVKFVEKPTLNVAQTYLASGDFAWNSGMFVLKASTWIKALGQFRPDILQACQAAWNGKTRDDLQMSGSAFSFVRPDPQAFATVPSESVDYAVLEKCPGSTFDIHMVPLLAGWSDLGAWDAVWQAGQTDAQGNVCHGDVMMEDVTNTYVHASSRLVTAVGVKDLVIVETADAVLVTDKAHSQQVKKIVTRLELTNRKEQNLHRKVHRPWGWYDSLDEGERFKVKRILVKPGASLSLQKHQHRAEHWIVVKGTAEVTCGDKVTVLSENQSTYICIGETHRLKNPGTFDLEIIEVQSGTYLGEDDIVRLQDNYGRTSIIPQTLKNKFSMNPICLILDVDGVLTTGHFVYSTEGKVFKIFGPDDNDGLSLLKNCLEIRFVTGDKKGFAISKKRIVDDMGMQLDLVSTVRRVDWIRERYPLDQVIYMGDGIFDHYVMKQVMYSIAPANADQLAKRSADFVTERKGGDRAVAEACLHILEKFFIPYNPAELPSSKVKISGEWAV